MLFADFLDFPGLFPTVASMHTGFIVSKKILCLLFYVTVIIRPEKED